MLPLKSVAIAPWSDCVDGDSASAQLLRKVARQNLGSLHGCIGSAPRDRESDQTRCDIYDPPAVIAERQELLR